jgi:predicted ATPase
MSNSLLNSLQLKGFRSFAPQSEAVPLTNLNVLIGPNGVGKSNFIEALELLHATPTDFSGVVRIGGTPKEWIWQGEQGATAARIEASLAPMDNTPELRYVMEFTDSAGRLEIADEVLEDAQKADLWLKDYRLGEIWRTGKLGGNLW